MAFGRSSTGEGHRGLGSRDAISVLERHQDGDLVVISNTGTVHYKYVGGVRTRIVAKQALDLACQWHYRMVETSPGRPTSMTAINVSTDFTRFPSGRFQKEWRHQW